MFEVRKKQCFGSSEDLYFKLHDTVPKVIHFLKQINGFLHCVPFISVLITAPVVRCLGR